MSLLELMKSEWRTSSKGESCTQLGGWRKEGRRRRREEGEKVKVKKGKWDGEEGKEGERGGKERRVGDEEGREEKEEESTEKSLATPT